MRHAIALAAVLGCAPSWPPSVPVDASPEASADASAVCVPGAQVACACVGGAQGVQRCAPDGLGLGVCECPDASAPMDVQRADAAPEASVEVDRAQPAEAAVDAVPADAARCPFGPAADCFGASVNLQTGVPRPNGTTDHCGACGHTCAAGTFCLMCVCER